MSPPRYWWERIPGLLNYELDELASVATRVELDEAARRRGQIRIAFTYHVDGRDVDLVAIYPDSYPYFRPELFAHGERLEHHQHPFRKNLCLMGRPTSTWYTEETLASFLQDQLATVFQTGRAKSREAVAGREEEQAEPFSEYYKYQPCSVLVDGSWNIDARYRSGGLALATRANSPVEIPLLQAALMEVKDDRGRPLQRAPSQWRRAFSGPRLYGRWVRADQPIQENDPDQFIRAAAGQPVPPGPEQRVGGWRLRVLGVLFPEETSHRRNGYGWVFACRAEGFGGALSPRDQRRAKSDRAGGGSMTYLMRAAYAGASDLQMRIPELKALRDRSVAVFGLGCLGAPSAMEFARAGVKRLSIVDHDVVEAGTVVRWPFGLATVGRAKCEVLAGFITANYPFTAVRQIPLRVGGVREGPEDKPERELLEEALCGIDLIYDATAELGVQHFLADRARELNVPYVAVSGTPGGWGGRVVRLAGADGPCWNCIQTAMDEPGAPRFCLTAPAA